jgi:hypothetical protein
MRYCLKIFLAILLIINLTSYALGQSERDDDNHFPDGCNKIGYKFELKTLYVIPEHTGARQSLYMIFNSSHDPITLYQLKKDNNTRNMYMNHKIAPQRWGVLATSELDLKFTCTKPSRDSRYGEIVDCAEVLQLCEFDKVRFGLNNRGNYWLTDSFTRNAGVRAIVHYGIIPYVR